MSWDKFGSPYDPGYRGKQPRPEESKKREREARELERHRLRGCYDPGCAICNPVTAAFAGRSTSFVRGGSMSIDFSSVDISGLTSNVEAIWGRGFERSAAASEPAPQKASPPASYRQAREAVEKWLIKAPDQGFDDIVGNDEALAQLRDAIQAPVRHKDLYQAYGMTMPKGAMLSGPPGCGKTMFARAAAAEMKRLFGDAVEFISISGSELQTPWVGETEKHIKAIFTFAREYQAFHGHPLLVFMDEAEVLLPDRTGRVRRVAPWEESQVATFLAEMDGMQASGAFVLLATNRPEVIDQAVLRDGRCDFKIVVKRPTPAAIETILAKNFAGTLIAEGADVAQLVFAAAECFCDPNKVIAEAATIGINFEELKLTTSHRRHFLFEHIVSGAMAASVPMRATRYAFSRDKDAGVARGVTQDDVVRAVSDLFEENRALDHSFALNEFKREYLAELKMAEA